MIRGSLPLMLVWSPNFVRGHRIRAERSLGIRAGNLMLAEAGEKRRREVPRMRRTRHKQLIPADGWYAVFEAAPEEPGVEEIRVPLVAWAAVEIRENGEEWEEMVGLVVEYEDQYSAPYLTEVQTGIVEFYGKFIRYERDDWNPEVRFEHWKD